MRHTRISPVDQPSLSGVRVSLLGGFAVAARTSTIVLPLHAGRVLAYLCLLQPCRATCTRSVLAERLWPDTPAERSFASLRTALWRLRQADERLVRTSRESVWLGDHVEVDVHESLAQATRLTSEESTLASVDLSVSTLVGELLPGWDEDWLLLERERVHQMQVHALEALAGRLCRLGQYSRAIDAAYRAIAAEPLRESAHGVLIDIHLVEGNVGEARKQFRRYAKMLNDELGLRPSAELLARLGATRQG
jgi:DNA-binding SARP family transcriptional activator